VTARKAFGALSSGWLAAFLVFLLLSAYLSFSPGENPYPDWTRFLFGTPAGLAVYLGLILNFLLAAMRASLKALSRKAPGPDTIMGMDSHAALTVPARVSQFEVADWMRKMGFRPRVCGNSVSAVKGRFSFLPGAFVRLGIAVLMMSSLASARGRDVSAAVMHEGDSADFFGRRVSLDGIRSGLPGTFLQVGDESSFRLKGVRAKLTVKGKAHDIGAGFPKRICGLHFKAAHFGYSQDIELETQEGKVSKRLDLDILPPGKVQTLPVPELSILMAVSLEPSKTSAKGLLKGKQFDLINPLYRLAVQKGEDADKLFSGTLGPGQSIRQADVNISLGDKGHYVKVEAIKDPALLWAYAGMVVLLAGLAAMPCRFFWYRKTLSAALKDDTLYMGYEEEYFRKWGVMKFEGWRETFASSFCPPVDEPRAAQAKEDTPGQCP
jgi:hypothetical protein